MNNRSLKILKTIIDWLSYFYEKHLHKKKNDLSYNSLSPTNNAEKVEEYLDTLEWALNNSNKIKNIAVAGPYGSGKSSVIQTFQNKKKNNKNYQFLNISLATFKEEKIEEDGKINKKKNNVLRLIELSILQQLFYHEKDSRIPDSRFKKIKNHKDQYLFGVTIGFIIFLISFLFLVFPQFLAKFSLFELTTKYINLFHTLSVVFVFVCSLFIILKSIRILKGFSIKKLGIGNTEIEIDNSISKSILNNHLDEILYFFEVTNYNVVIIEDLDRFEQTDIFTKLREINLLINGSKKIEKDIVFIYAIRDDMFQDKDRTKFFDFVIPIIPVINSSNSNEKLLKIIETNDYDISTDLIDDVSLFIDDMRLLYNIMNEYHIYFKNLNTSLIQDKLLAMIVYKNIYPNDFTKLGQNDGELFDVITRKHKYINEKTTIINEEIFQIKSKINENETVRIRDIKELRLIYISKIVEKIIQSGQAFRSFSINNQECSISKATEDDIFNQLKTETSAHYIYNSNVALIRVNYNFNNIETEIDSKLSYIDREQLVLGGRDVEQFRQDIENLEEKKNNIKKYKLKDLITGKEINIGSNYKSQNELINILLRNGYIDEDYLDYISIFYEGSLSKNDHQFLINVKTQLETDFNYPLQKKENLVKRINEFDFEKEFILNYALVDYLLTSTKYHTKKEKIFKQLKNESEYSIRFIDGFIDYTSNIELFIKLLCKDWINIWGFIENKSNFPKDKVEKYFKLVIKYAEVHSISNIFRNSRTTISNNKDFLQIIKDTNKLKEIIEELDIKFSTLNESAPKELLEFVYNESYYDISPKMIKFILIYKDKFIQLDFDSKNYYLIKLSKLDELINYIEENLNEYITSVYLKIESNKNEPEEYFIQLLNNEDLLDENKEQILTKTDTIISDINEVGNLDLIKLLFSESKVLATWANLISIFKENENTLTEELVLFINVYENAQKLSEKRISKDYPDKEIANLFIIAILLNDNITIANYSLILKSVPYIYNSLNFENLSFEKIKMLIEKNKLTTNSENYELVKANYDNLHISLIENNPIKFIENIDSFELESEDVLELLKSDKMSILIKEKVIEHFEETFFTLDAELLTQIGKLLLEHNNFNIDSIMVIPVMTDSNLGVYEKIKLFNINSNTMRNNEFDNFLTSIGEPYSNIVLNGKRPLLDDNDTNRDLAENLKLKNYISKYDFEEKGIRISTFRNK